MSDKRIVPALILCFFFGVFGAHRFYVGKIPTAIIQLLTLGGLGIWMVIDLILIILREFRDGEGKLRWRTKFNTELMDFSLLGIIDSEGELVSPDEGGEQQELPF